MATKIPEIKLEVMPSGWLDLDGKILKLHCLEDSGILFLYGHCKEENKCYYIASMEIEKKDTKEK